ncbi:MAG: hypothetical protein KF752_18770 [Pirellulaceae bacterium]|nr:hypothetical protein [Pirellulaceae bacterium]
MSESTTAPWIHIGECPICGDGLCRVRCYQKGNEARHLYAMCDECEAIWLLPSTSTAHFFPDSEHPLCPISGEFLFGDNSRWASLADLRGSQWENEVIINLPGDISIETVGGEFVTGEDQAGALDVPPVPARTGVASPSAEPHSKDLAYGQDEPRPGC